MLEGRSCQHRLQAGEAEPVTATKSRRILITRPQPVADEFAGKLKDEGFEVYLAPMTEYVEQPGSCEDIAHYQGIIFTSAQAVHLFAAREVERYIAVFAVGEATAQAAKAEGYRRINLATGDSDAVISLIKREKAKYELKRMLHPCGEDTAQDIGAALKSEGIYVDRLVVYKAKFMDHLPGDVTKSLQDGDITTVTLFSARTAANFTRMLQSAELAGVSADLEAVCLSDRVAAEIKGVPWRVVRVARAPHIESVLEILRTRDEHKPQGPVLLAEPVITAFGGIRPLANKLDITASTVQGWKNRGVIPQSRADAVFDAARAAGIDYKGFMSNDKGTTSAMDDDKTPKNDAAGNPLPPRQKTAAEIAAQAQNEKERRRGQDRRQKHTPLDNRGFVNAKDYVGPDRREGMDRRSYHARQAHRIKSEKWYFINRSLIMGSLFTMCVLYAGSFLMGPELLDWKREGDQMKQMQARVDQMNQRLIDMQEAQKKQRSIGNVINQQIEKVQDAANGVTNTVTSAGDTAAGLMQTTETGRDLTAVLQVLSNLKSMNQTKEGRAASVNAMSQLKGALAASSTDPNGMNAAVAAAAGRDKNLAKLLGNVNANDLGAAALLLTLNEFRSNIGSSKPFSQDLALMQKYAGTSPEMQKSLQRLAPYAQNGILSRQALQEQFKGLASDIVMAKLQGQDLSVKQQMLARMGKLIKVRKVDDIQGNGVDAVVARAQLKLNGGDVRSAMQELQTLDGAPAQTAAPFMDAAAGNVMADDATTQMLQMVMSKFTDGTGNISVDGIVDQVKGLMGGLGGGLDFGGASGGGSFGSSPTIYVSPGVYNNPSPDQPE